VHFWCALSAQAAWAAVSAASAPVSAVSPASLPTSAVAPPQATTIAHHANTSDSGRYLTLPWRLALATPSEAQPPQRLWRCALHAVPRTPCSPFLPAPALMPEVRSGYPRNM
jgi:hypothetical protein